ncbi:hypothetical protein QE152_g7982 [Popillia japonica]|uniref:Uncharacterized protein n=1 Tax=Popillia japonica TaxID=7064 RepID=A0AAW1MDE9_POPJA
MKKRGRKHQRGAYKSGPGAIHHGENNTMINTNVVEQQKSDNKKNAISKTNSKNNEHKIAYLLNELMQCDGKEAEPDYYDSNYYPIPNWFDHVVQKLAADVNVHN